MPITDADIAFAREALGAAELGAGQASPNPLVGAVVVRDGEIVGRGTHYYADRKHAEVVALESAGERARGATVYVNLEPCGHHGRTGPCADALIQAGVARVVSSMTDPAPYVNGRGFERLREAGIEVEIGALEADAARLNERYLAHIRTGKPFVLLKVAETLDGRVAAAKGRSEWITGDAARVASHELRRAYDAILVGVGTVAADNPSLNYRGNEAKRLPLVRAVLDPTLRTSIESKLVGSVDRGPVVLYAAPTAAGDRREVLAARGVEIVDIDVDASGSFKLEGVLEDLGSRGVHGLIVEGGPETSARFVRSGFVDKVVFYIAPLLLGGRDAVGAIGGDGPRELSGGLRLERIAVREVGDDLEITGYPVMRG